MEARAQTTIMPLGDSGTEGIDYLTISSGGYRDPLYHDLVASGISFTFIGTNTDHPTPALTAASQIHHNGYGGYTIADIDSNLSANGGQTSNLGGYWFTSGSAGGTIITPNIILLEIGANDILKGHLLSDTETALNTLITHIHTLTPTSIIMVAAIYPFSGSSSTYNGTIASYNQYIQNTLVPSLSYTRFVDNYSTYFNADGSVNASLLGADNIHFTRYGYTIWANNWAKALRTQLGVNPAYYSVGVTNATLNCVTTSGSFPAGSVVTIQATPPAGNQFTSWSPGTTAIDNPYWSLGTYVVPAANSTLTASYAANGTVSSIIPNGTYQIMAGNYQFSWYDGFSVGAVSAASGAAVQTQTYTGTSTQQWVLTNLPPVSGTNNVVELSLPGTSLAMTVSSTASGATVSVATYTGASGQQWVVSGTLGITQLTNLGSGFALNIPSLRVNTTLTQAFAQYTGPEAWAFYPASSGGAPSAPTGLTATAGNAQIGLNWTAGSGATSYNVYRGTTAGGESTTPIATGITTTSYTNTGLSNGTTYYYKVISVNGSGTSGYSNEASATPSAAPGNPSGLTATAGNAQVGLNWTTGSGATSYNVYRGTTVGGESTTPIATGIATTSYTNTGLTNGTTYYYKVASVNASGTSGYSNEANATPVSSGTGLPSPWTHQDVGAVPTAGTASYSGGVFTVAGSGNITYGTTSDQFQYAYQAVSGDCTITARVVSESPTATKGGVMIRETTADNSAHKLETASAGSLLYYIRATTSGTSAKGNQVTNALPYWVRVQRVGNTITSYYSSSGAAGSWTTGAAHTITMASGVTIGMAVASTGTSLGTATFDNVSVTTP